MVLDRGGLTGEVIGVTQYFGGDRSEEIADWLNTHHVDEFVVLDDDADIENHFVRTDYKIGLTFRDIERAVEILGEVS